MNNLIIDLYVDYGKKGAVIVNINQKQSLWTYDNIYSAIKTPMALPIKSESFDKLIVNVFHFSCEYKNHNTTAKLNSHPFYLLAFLINALKAHNIKYITLYGVYIFRYNEKRAYLKLIPGTRGDDKRDIKKAKTLEFYKNHKFIKENGIQILTTKRYTTKEVDFSNDIADTLLLKEYVEKGGLPY